MTDKTHDMHVNWSGMGSIRVCLVDLTHDEYQLVLDTETFHGLNRAQREAMAREVDAVAGPDATVLLLVWEPKRRGPLPRGATRDEIKAAFPGWTVTDMGPSQFEAPKPVELLFTPNEHWYRLRRE